MSDRRGSAYDLQVLAGIVKLKSGERPVLCEEVFGRLVQGMYVTELTLMRCVEALINFEDARAPTGSSRSRSHPDSINYIDRVLENCGDRFVLCSALLRRKGQLLVGDAVDKKSAIPVLEDAFENVEIERLRMDRQRNAILIDLGHGYLNAGLTEEAENSFLKVLAYPWYTIENRPEDLQALRALYIQAGRGLIALRSGDKAKLSSTIFVPASMEVLGPELRRALASIKE